MGIGWTRPCFTETMPNVEVTERWSPSTGEQNTIVEYRTALGTLTERVRKEPGVGKWKEQGSWKDVSPWTVERRIRKLEDYDVAKFLAEDTVYEADYFPIEQAKRWLGEDGIVFASLPRSPMQMLMVDWVGIPKFYLHYTKHRDKIEELYDAISKKYEEIYEIAANCPADAIMFGDNLDAVLVTPRLFKDYFMPSYRACAAIVHSKGKLLASHFDGRLGVLKDLIASCPQDIIDGFHPPPMGDLPLSDALRLWKDKVILVGFPCSIYSGGTEAVREYLLNLLSSIIPGDRVEIIASSENLVSDEHLLAMSAIMEKATLPLTKEKLAEIRTAIS